RSYRGARTGPGGGSDRDNGASRGGRSSHDLTGGRGRSNRSSSGDSLGRGSTGSDLGRSSGDSLGLSTNGSRGRADPYPLPAAADRYQRTSPGPDSQPGYALPPLPVPPADPLTRDPYLYPAGDHGYQPAAGAGYHNGNQNGNGHGDSGQPWNAARYASSYQPGSYQPPAGGQAPPPDGSGADGGWYPLPPAASPAPASPVPGSMPAAPAPGGPPGSAPDAAQYPYPSPGPGYPAAGYGGDQAGYGYPEAYEDYRNGYASGYGGYGPDPYPPDGYHGYHPQG
ncbi:MAG: hypothetical protein J2P30_16680, partial [Actinobacteria bacterium]|nr:hypothetical protein [Actinomycetota bacterium]